NVTPSFANANSIMCEERFMRLVKGSETKLSIYVVFNYWTKRTPLAFGMLIHGGMSEPLSFNHLEKPILLSRRLGHLDDHECIICNTDMLTSPTSLIICPKCNACQTCVECIMQTEVNGVIRCPQCQQVISSRDEMLIVLRNFNIGMS